MKSFRSIFAGFVFLATLLVATARAGSFDGSWQVTLDTPEYKDPTGMVVLGYHFQFPATVKNGVLHGERGAQGQPGSLEIDGSIEANGDALLQVHGIVARPEYALTHAETGHPYKYDVKAHFERTKGSGSRVGGRVSNFTFITEKR